MLKRIILMSILISSTILNAKVTTVGKGLAISPQVVLLNGQKTNATFTLRNNGNKKLEVSVSTIDMIMTEKKTFEVTKNPTNSLGRNLRYSPRRIVIAPGEQQKVRIMLRSARKFQDKEYISRIVFTAIAPKPKKQLEVKNSGVSFNINLQLSTLIPIYYAPDGVQKSKTRVEDVKYRFKNGYIYINYTDFRVQGKTTPRYKRIISWLNPDGTEVNLSTTVGVAIQFPLEKVYRKTSIKIDSKIDSKIDKKGKLKIINIIEDA